MSRGSLAAIAAASAVAAALSARALGKAVRASGRRPLDGGTWP
jgi:hypothetical protein